MALARVRIFCASTESFEWFFYCQTCVIDILWNSFMDSFTSKRMNSQNGNDRRAHCYFNASCVATGGFLNFTEVRPILRWYFLAPVIADINRVKKQTVHRLSGDVRTSIRSENVFECTSSHHVTHQ